MGCTFNDNRFNVRRYFVTILFHLLGVLKFHVVVLTDIFRIVFSGSRLLDLLQLRNWCFIDSETILGFYGLTGFTYDLRHLDEVGGGRATSVIFVIKRHFVRGQKRPLLLDELFPVYNKSLMVHSGFVSEALKLR